MHTQRRDQATPVHAAVLMIAAATACISCASLPQEKIIANEQSRIEQQQKGYFDRESSEQQKKADQRAYQETLRRKS